MAWRPNKLVAISTIVGLSLLAAVVLFGFLKSTGVVKNDAFELGGAAAGFLITLWTLRKWHDAIDEKELEELRTRTRQLTDQLGQLEVPAMQLPAGYTSFVDREHSLQFGYPSDWKKQPMLLQLNSAFHEDPLRVKPGDPFSGKFNLVIASPGRHAIPIGQVMRLATQRGVGLDELSEKLGIELSDETADIQVPQERLLSALGVEGDTLAERYYNLNYGTIEDSVADEVVSRQTLIVDGIQSMLVEWKTKARYLDEDLVTFGAFTYIPKANLLAAFTFTDNEADRDTMDKICHQVLATVRFWNSAADG